jgi:hypothetical protein
MIETAFCEAIWIPDHVTPILSQSAAAGWLLFGAIAVTVAWNAGDFVKTIVDRTVT